MQGFEARVLEGGARTLLGRRIPFIQTEVGPAMLASAGGNATAYLERFVQVRQLPARQGRTGHAQWRQSIKGGPTLYPVACKRAPPLPGIPTRAL